MAVILPRTLPPAADGAAAELEATLARLPDDWTLLPRRRIGGSDGPEIAVVLIHAEIGAALVDLDQTRADQAAAALEQLVVQERIARDGETLPVVRLAVGAGEIAEIGERLAASFERAPRCDMRDAQWPHRLIDTMLSAEDAAMLPLRVERAAPDVPPPELPPVARNAPSPEPLPEPPPPARIFRVEPEDAPILHDDGDEDAAPLAAQPRRMPAWAALGLGLLILAGGASAAYFISDQAPAPQTAALNPPLSAPTTLAPTALPPQAAPAVRLPGSPPPMDNLAGATKSETLPPVASPPAPQPELAPQPEPVPMPKPEIAAAPPPPAQAAPATKTPAAPPSPPMETAAAEPPPVQSAPPSSLQPPEAATSPVAAAAAPKAPVKKEAALAAAAKPKPRRADKKIASLEPRKPRVSAPAPSPAVAEPPSSGGPPIDAADLPALEGADTPPPTQAASAVPAGTPVLPPSPYLGAPAPGAPVMLLPRPEAPAAMPPAPGMPSIGGLVGGDSR